jgi:hypothetical protein
MSFTTRGRTVDEIYSNMPTETSRIFQTPCLNAPYGVASGLSGGATGVFSGYGLSRVKPSGSARAPGIAEERERRNMPGAERLRRIGGATSWRRSMCRSSHDLPVSPYDAFEERAGRVSSLSLVRYHGTDIKYGARASQQLAAIGVRRDELGGQCLTDLRNLRYR